MALVMPVVLSACADFFGEYEEMEYIEVDDMKGRGLFTGQSGEWVVYQR